MLRLMTFLLSLAFFLSGFSALLYQVVWQRQLSASFGVDADASTLIVSIFMFGLGVGALAGGALADRYQKQTLSFYLGAELGIAAFGVASISILRRTSEYLAVYPESISYLVLFLILVLPTALMGGTLPLVGALLAREGMTVGLSIGTLYRANTIGAALGAMTAALFLFYFLTLSQTLALAAILNITSASIALCCLRGFSANRVEKSR